MNSTPVKRAIARANNYRNDSDDGCVRPMGLGSVCRDEVWLVGQNGLSTHAATRYFPSAVIRLPSPRMAKECSGDPDG